MSQSLTLKQYLDNPMGKGTSIAGNQEVLKRNYMDQMLALENKITYKWYTIKDKLLVCHIKLPSSNEKNGELNIFYDVIFEFDTSNLQKQITINELPLRVYSNCPSFVFTYAHAFYKEGILCDWLKTKYPKQVITKEAVEKNTHGLIGYEKSIYTCGLYLLKDQRNYIATIRKDAVSVSNYADIVKNVQNSDAVLQAINEAKKKNRDATKVDTSKVSPSKRNSLQIQLRNGEHFSPFTKITKAIPYIGKTKTTSKTKSTKKVKKI